MVLSCQRELRQDVRCVYKCTAAWFSVYFYVLSREKLSGRVRVFRVLQHATKRHIGFVRGAGEISKPLAVSLAAAAMSIPQI